MSSVWGIYREVRCGIDKWVPTSSKKANKLESILMAWLTKAQSTYCSKVISQFRAMSTNHLRFAVTEISTGQKSIYDDDGNEAMTRGTRRRSCWQRAIGLLYTLKTHFRPASKSKKPPQKQTPLFNSCSSKADPTLHIQAKEREASTFLPTAHQ